MDNFLFELHIFRRRPSLKVLFLPFRTRYLNFYAYFCGLPFHEPFFQRNEEKDQ